MLPWLSNRANTLLPGVMTDVQASPLILMHRCCISTLINVHGCQNVPGAPLSAVAGAFDSESFHVFLTFTPTDVSYLASKDV